MIQNPSDVTANPDPSRYLGTCKVIETTAAAVTEQARQLADRSVESTAQNCFEFVRNSINHSEDFQQNPVTYRATEVLEHRTGYCYAKSHLLCALLRANGIPAGLCYQRLSIGGDGAPFCLHGLNAVYLPDHGWYRIDARGNRTDVDAQFTPPIERLAFHVTVEGEADLPGIWNAPHPAVTACLLRYDDWLDVSTNLPDAEPKT